MDKLDKEILNILQEDFPLHKNPYLVIAQNLGLSQEEVLERINRLKDQGIIRRIGAIIDARSMGFYSTLCATKVLESKIEEVAAIINAQAGVTHNYIREHQLNMWFTLTAESQNKASQILMALEKDAGIKIYAMPAQKLYKIKVALEIGATI